MSTFSVALNSFYRPLPLRTAPPPSQPLTLRRLQVLLARDEQVRRPPPITLPLAAPSTESPRPSPPAPEPAIPTVAEIVAAVGARFGVPVALAREQERANAPRHLAEEVVIYLVRNLRRQTMVATALELDVSPHKIWNINSKIQHQRTVDPQLDRTISAIEAQLGAAR